MEIKKKTKIHQEEKEQKQKVQDTNKKGLQRLWHRYRCFRMGEVPPANTISLHIFWITFTEKRSEDAKKTP